jgi:hypothetical protein
VIYVPGNHDYDLRGLAGAQFSGPRVQRHATRPAADGRRLVDETNSPYPVASLSNDRVDLVARRLEDRVVGTHRSRGTAGAAPITATPRRRSGNAISGWRCRLEKDSQRSRHGRKKKTPAFGGRFPFNTWRSGRDSNPRPPA